MNYRSEIDGLRALAVLPVILFHAGSPLFPGGFVGVDVFFVISGYLISLILLSDLSSGTFSLWRFYERRIRRILPALFVVMATCVPFAWFLMVPYEFDVFARMLLGVALFISNVFAWQETGYFAPDAENNPLLHTWSLAVEEQFYVLFPLILLAIWRYARRFLWAAFVGAAALSLATAEWGLTDHAAAVFFLSPTRAWELLVGCTAALWVHKRGAFKSDVLAAIGLVLVLGSVFLLSGESRFPGVSALPAVAGTALVLVCATSGTRTAALLSLGPLTAIGLISYSAYLWHQPVFSFARLAERQEPEPIVMVALGTLTLVLAALTWRYVEQPFRNRQLVLPRRRSLFGAAAAVAAAFVVSGLTLSNETSFHERLSAEQRRVFAYYTYWETETFQRTFHAPACFEPDKDFVDYIDPDRCLALSDDKPNIALIGDSHAAHLFHGLAETFPEVNFVQLSAPSCRPVAPFGKDSYCRGLYDYVFETWLPVHKGQVDAILLSARWREPDLVGLEETFDAWTAVGVPIYVSGPTFEVTPELPVLLVRAESDTDAEALLNANLKARPFEVSDILAERLQHWEIPYFPLAQAICPDRTCPPYSGDRIPTTWDYGHLTWAGSIRAAQLMRDGEFFKPLLSAD